MHAFSMMSDGFFLSLSLCLDIGLVNVAMISLTLSHGFKPGFWLGLGSCIGDLIYAALALAGMAALLQFESVRWVVWIGGAAILLFLTWKMAREASTRPRRRRWPARWTPMRRICQRGAAFCGASCWRCRRLRRFSGSLQWVAR
jgi:threonine/homoserine/homoserine lactone efflux protein